MTRRPIFRVGPLGAGRVEAFSDGVLAVVITLLVLEVRLPADLKNEDALWKAVWRIAPVLGAWAVSFAFILVFWVNHHSFFASLKYVDRGQMWLNGLFLLSITLIPVPTGPVGAHPGFTAPLALLGAAMLFTSLSFALMRLYASFHGRMLKGHLDARSARAGMIQSAAAPLIYVLALGLAFVWPPGSIAVQVIVLLVFFLRSPGRRAPATLGD